jgi:hypothetical protein
VTPTVPTPAPQADSLDLDINLDLKKGAREKWYHFSRAPFS